MFDHISTEVLARSYLIRTIPTSKKLSKVTPIL